MPDKQAHIPFSAPGRVGIPQALVLQALPVGVEEASLLTVRGPIGLANPMDKATVAAPANSGLAYKGPSYSTLRPMNDLYLRCLFKQVI